MLQVHVPYSNSGRRESEVSIKWILRLPYLKGVPINQSPKLFAHHGRILDTSGGGIGGRVHHILIPETSVQDVKHKSVVFFGQVDPLEFQAVGCQDPQAKELVV